jgi:3,4-dihydroxy 2-butanone 4-phosphate synthase/GTP cyclohydrolase II
MGKQTRPIRSAEESIPMSLDRIEDAIAAIAAGELIVVVDDEDRENEGDLVMAAEKAKPDQVAFMIRHTSGILCTPLTAEDAARLHLAPMVQVNNAPLETAFTVSIDYRHGLTTGISAEERTATIRALANNNAGAADFVRPGHIFPLVGKPGGVLARSGHTEAAIDVARLAGLSPVGLLAELVNDDGTVKRLPELIAFARAHKLRIVSIADLIQYRQRFEKLVSRVDAFEVDLGFGAAQGIVYATPADSIRHLALCVGDLRREPVAVRIHRESVFDDVFGAVASGREQLVARALRVIRSRGTGVIVYLRAPEGYAKVPEWDAPEAHTDAPPPESLRQAQWREVGIGAQILRDLGISSIELLASKNRHYVGLDGYGITIAKTTILD